MRCTANHMEYVEIIGIIMPYKLTDENKVLKNIDIFKGVPLIPNVGKGKESRINKRSLRFFSTVALKMKDLSRTARSSGLRRGKGIVHRESKSFQQRVLIKSRIVRSKSKRERSLRMHVLYLQREGVGIDKSEPMAFGKDSDLSRDEVSTLANDWNGDRHHFRFIVSPERGADLDLENFARDLMNKVSEDCKTPLQWIGVAHYNTEHPHVHIALRGKEYSGADLVLTRDYIARGIRAAAEQIVTRELGYRKELDIQKDIEKSLKQNRITPIDRELEKEVSGNPDRLVDLTSLSVVGESKLTRSRANVIKRLCYLEELGLTSEVEPSVWRIDERLIDRLDSLGAQNDIIKTMHRRIRGIDPNSEVHFVTTNLVEGTSIVGRVIHTGLVDELYSSKFILIKDAADRVHHVALPKSLGRGKVPDIGDTVRVDIRKENLLTKSDQNIMEFSKLNNGHYTVPEHQAYVSYNVKLPQGVSVESYVENHRKRINSLQRMGFIEEVSSNVWKIPHDLVQKVSQSQRCTISVEIIEKARNREREL